jgi:hypothetical protein
MEAQGAPMERPGRPDLVEERPKRAAEIATALVVPRPCRAAVVAVSHGAVQHLGCAAQGDLRLWSRHEVGHGPVGTAARAAPTANLAARRVTRAILRCHDGTMPTTRGVWKL